MDKRPFHVVDVFASEAFRGNPVMVVLADDALDAARMQVFAAWNGMPETVYLGRRTGGDAERAGYSARIFSPRAELAFAGHPSLGAAHVAVEAGIVPRPAFESGDGPSQGDLRGAATLWQACGVGDVELRMLRTTDGGMQAYVKTPRPGTVVALSLDQARAAADAIGYLHAIPAYRVGAGANWVVVKLQDASALESLKPDMPAIEALSAALGVSGVSVYADTRDDSEARFEVRSFGPAIGVPEDAVCGGGNACVATLQQHLDAGRAAASSAAYQTRQGRFVGRDGCVQIMGPVEDARFWIGGMTRTMMSGMVSI